jgi:GDPmannose 4,6-dehydratase
LVYKKRALITGAAGQDGLLLTRKLTAEGYEVVGLVRSAAQAEKLQKYANGAKSLTIVHKQISPFELQDLVRSFAPQEIYNLAATSSVANSWQFPGETIRTNMGSLADLLDAVAKSGDNGSGVKVFQASSSEMFGDTGGKPADESTAFNPTSPYATSKAGAHGLINVYKNAYGLDIRTGILFNHESPLRPETFVTRKITKAVAEINWGLREELQLGNINVSRDWGYAPDYVNAMLLIMRAERADDYVVATGVLSSLTKFLKVAFESIGISNWEDRTKAQQLEPRPNDLVGFSGDSSKLSNTLKWRPTKTFEQLVEIMVQEDLRKLITQEPAKNWFPEETND